MSTFSAVLLALIVFFVIVPLGSCVACAVCAGIRKGADTRPLAGDAGAPVVTATAVAPTATTTAKHTVAASAEPVDLSIDVSELLKAYKANEVRADAKYKGKRVRIRGLAGDMKKDILEHIYVTVGTGAEFEIPEAQCFFDDSNARWVASISRGDHLVLNCTVDGLMMNVLMKDCIAPDTDTLNACYQLKNAGIAKDCVMNTGNVDSTTFATYAFVKDTDDDKGIGTIVKLDATEGYDDALAQIQKNIDESDGGVGKVLGSPSARIVVLLPPKAPKDLAPRVKAVVDRLPSQ